MTSTSVRVDAQVKARLDRMQALMQARVGNRLSHSQVLDALIALADGGGAASGAPFPGLSPDAPPAPQVPPDAPPAPQVLPDPPGRPPHGPRTPSSGQEDASPGRAPVPRPTWPRLRWRTVLFTPADRPDRVEKAWRTGAADLVVADLEDAVAPHMKQEARHEVARLLAAPGPWGCLRGVRVNGWPGATGEADVARLAPLRPDVLVVPKAEDPQEIHRLRARMALESGDFGDTSLMLILETPAGILHAPQLCRVPGVAAVAFGAEDLAAAARMRRTRSNHEVATARALVALAAAAAGIAAVDMVTPDLRDTARVADEARQARDLGYQGKMCLHPAQVDAVDHALAPTPEERAHARRILEEVARAGPDGGGVVVVDGKMVDRPLVRQAERVLRDW